MKLTKSQNKLLEELRKVRVSVQGSLEKRNLALPYGAILVPFIRVFGARDKNAADKLEAAGYLLQIAPSCYMKPWKQRKERTE